VHSTSLTHTADVRSDGLYLALFAAACALLLSAARRGGWRWAAAGTTAGLAYLTRPEGLFLVLPAGLALAGAVRAAGARRALAGGAAFAAGLLLLAVPYVRHIHGATGVWALSMKPSLSAAGLAEAGAVARLPPGCPLASPVVRRASNSQAAPPAPPEPAQAATTTAAPQEPGEVAHAPSQPMPASPLGPVPALAFGEAADGNEADLAPGEASPLHALAQAARTLASATRWDILLLAVLGAAVAWRTRSGALLAGALVLGMWVVAAAAHARASGYLGQRHMLGPVQLLFPAAGLGLLALWDAGRFRVAARIAAGAVVLLAAFGGVKDRHRDDAARVNALALARVLTTPDQSIVVHRRKDGWYARRRVIVVELPCRDEDLAATMARERSTLLVLEADQLVRDAPHWLDGTRFAEVGRFTIEDETVLVLRPRS
jgi:hypothetical protein